MLNLCLVKCFYLRPDCQRFQLAIWFFDTTGLLAGVDDVGTSAIDVGHTKNDEEFGS